MNYRIFVTALSILLSLNASSRADETAVSFNDSSILVGGTGSNVYGWEFSASSDVQVTSLGVYDYFKGDGLLAQHAVGIWDVSDPSQLLVSAIIPAGNSAPIVQDFRFVDISPVTLAGGHDYVVAALYQSDDNSVGSLNAPGWQLTVGPGLQFGGYRSGDLPTTALIFPVNYISGQEEAFGPNFTYNVVPEPSMPSLCVLGAVVLFFLRKNHALAFAHGSA